MVVDLNGFKQINDTLGHQFGDIVLAASSERLVAAGIELADTEGVDALTMRRLAERLGFKVMALYDHVEAMDFANAHRLAGGMVGFALLVLVTLYVVNRPRLDRAQSAR